MLLGLRVWGLMFRCLGFGGFRGCGVSCIECFLLRYAFSILLFGALRFEGFGEGGLCAVELGVEELVGFGPDR